MLGSGETLTQCTDGVRCRSVVQLLAHQRFLAIQLRRDEFTRDAQCGAIAECQCLRSAQPCFRWRCRSGDNADLTETIKHRERRANIAEPSQGRERNEAVIADADKTLEPVIHARQAQRAALRPDAVLNLKMASLHRDAYAVAI